MSHAWSLTAAVPAPAPPRAAAGLDLLAVAERCASVVMLMMMSGALLGRIGDPLQTGEGAAWLLSGNALRFLGR